MNHQEKTTDIVKQLLKIESTFRLALLAFPETWPSEPELEALAYLQDCIELGTDALAEAIEKLDRLDRLDLI
jgi:hypothetical protein